MANVNDAFEQSSLCNNFDETSANNPDTVDAMTDKCPDLMPYLEKNRVTGKRSRPCRGMEIRSACKGSIGKCQLQQKDDDGKVLCFTSCKVSVELLASCASGAKDISHAIGALPVSLDMERAESVSLSAEGLEACGDSKVEPCLAEVQRRLLCAETCTSDSFVNFNVPQEDKPVSTCSNSFTIMEAHNCLKRSGS